jgi:hypothetical protein
MPVALHGSATTRILVVATVRLYRECLAVALSNRPGIAVVGTAAEGDGGSTTRRDHRYGGRGGGCGSAPQDRDLEAQLREPVWESR